MEEGTRDWKKYKVDDPKKNIPDSVYYIPDFITEGEEEILLKSVDSAPKPKWTVLSNRRLQNWGGFPHPKVTIGEPLPAWLQTYTKRLSDMDIFDGKTPNHVLVNEYLPGQGILPHEDGPLFYPTITTISLGCHTIINLYPKNDVGDSKRPSTCLLLMPRSLVIFKDVSYTSYLHGIQEVTQDMIDPENTANLHMISEKIDSSIPFDRSRRISLTIRHVPNMRKNLNDILKLR